VFDFDTWLAFTVACLALTLSPGPAGILTIGKGISQGKLAAFVVAISIGLGTLVHVLAATFGLTLLIQKSEVAFSVVKTLGTVYLIWIGVKIILKRDLISFGPLDREPLRSIFITGFFTVLFNPRAGIFVLAFIPQFIDPNAAPFTTQMLLFGIWFAILSVLVLSLIGLLSETISSWVKEKPKLVFALNIGGGLIFLLSGVSVANLRL